MPKERPGQETSWRRQGESNTDSFQGTLAGPANYACRMRAAVQDWPKLQAAMLADADSIADEGREGEQGAEVLRPWLAGQPLALSNLEPIDATALVWSLVAGYTAAYVAARRKAFGAMP